MNEDYEMKGFLPFRGTRTYPLMYRGYSMEELGIERGMKNPKEPIEKPIPQVMPDVIQELKIHPNVEPTNVEINIQPKLDPSNMELNIAPKMDPNNMELNIAPKMGAIKIDPIKLELKIQPVMDPTTMKLMIQPMMMPMAPCPMMMTCPITKCTCHMMMKPMAMQHTSMYPHSFCNKR